MNERRLQRVLDTVARERRITLERGEEMSESVSELLSECEGIEHHCHAVAAAPIEGFNPLAFLALVKAVKDLVAGLAALVGNPEFQALLVNAKKAIDEIKLLLGMTPTPAPTPVSPVV